MKRLRRSLKRSVLASLCAATVLGVVGVPGAHADSRPSSVAASVYVVKAGDSLSGIASRAGVSLAALLSANGFQRTTVIHPGQKIALPSGSVSGGVAATSATAPPAFSAAAVKLIKVVEFAKAQVGKPYRFAAAGPDAYDCSGLVLAAFRQIGMSLPHSSFEQSKRGTAVDWRTQEIRPGDLVFTFSSTNPTQISHVGIAISDSQWIEAPFTGANVRIASMPSDTRIQAVRRLVTP